jgi:hypothetical protein
MMQKVLATGVLGLMLVGCAADSGWKVAYEQERASRQEQDARIRNLEAQQRQLIQKQTPTPQQPQAQQSVQRKATIAEVVEKCQKLQDDRNFPIGCSTGIVEGTPYIEFAFLNLEGIQQYWDTITKIFIEDFCGRHNDAGNKAMVFAKLVKPGPGAIRGGACFSNDVSEWRSLKETTPSSNSRY